MTHATDKRQAKSGQEEAQPFCVKITSFGYKEGPPPAANIVFDVRFLKNPYWVPELRPLNGLDAPVQQYVLEQQAAQTFLESVAALAGNMIPRLTELGIFEFTIAFGCTGGQHRSTTMVEVLAERLARDFPQITIKRSYRELSGPTSAEQEGK